MHMTCRHNVKVTVYSHCPHIMCVHAELFFLMDIIILTAQFMEANNYVTQEGISPPRLGHFLVLSSLSLCFSVLPLLCHINVSLTAPLQTLCLFISCDSWEKHKMHWSPSSLFKAARRFLSSQSLLSRRGQREGWDRGESNWKRWEVKWERGKER